jgi:26S proteasome regulatory subunit N2
MVLALGAGKLFQLDSGGEYEETIIGKMGDSIRFISICSL